MISDRPRAILPYALLKFERKKKLRTPQICRKIYGTKTHMLKEAVASLRLERSRTKPSPKKVMAPSTLMNKLNISDATSVATKMSTANNVNVNTTVKKITRDASASDLTSIRARNIDPRLDFIPLGKPLANDLKPKSTLQVQLTRVESPSSSFQTKIVESRDPRLSQSKNKSTYAEYIAKHKKKEILENNNIKAQTQNFDSKRTYVPPSLPLATTDSDSTNVHVDSIKIVSAESLLGRRDESEDDVNSVVEANIETEDMRIEETESTDQLNCEDSQYSDNSDDSDEEEIDFLNLDALYLRIKSSEDMINHLSQYNQYLNDEYSKNVPRWRLMYEKTGKVDVKFRGASSLQIKLKDATKTKMSFLDPEKTKLNVNDPTNKLMLDYENKRKRNHKFTASNQAQHNSYNFNSNININEDNNKNVEITDNESCINSNGKRTILQDHKDDLLKKFKPSSTSGTFLNTFLDDEDDYGSTNFEMNTEDSKYKNSIISNYSNFGNDIPSIKIEPNSIKVQNLRKLDQVLNMMKQIDMRG